MRLRCVVPMIEPKSRHTSLTECDRKAKKGKERKMIHIAIPTMARPRCETLWGIDVGVARYILLAESVAEIGYQDFNKIDILYFIICYIAHYIIFIHINLRNV